MIWLLIILGRKCRNHEKLYLLLHRQEKEKLVFTNLTLRHSSVEDSIYQRVSDLEFLPDFLYPIHAEIDSGLVHWLTNVAEVGQMFIHRRGCIVRMQDNRKTLHEEDL